MKKYVSCIGDRFSSIEVSIDTDGIMGGNFGYPIISCMNTIANGEHVEVINFGNANTDFNSIKNDIVNLGIIAGYTNVVFDQLIVSEQMCNIFEYIVNNTTEDDELYVDITTGSRFFKFALAFSARYLAEVKHTKCKIVKAKNDTNVVEDVSNDYFHWNMMSPITQFLIDEGCIDTNVDKGDK